MCVITKNRIRFAVCRSQKQGRPASKVQNEMCMYSERKMELRGFSQDTVCFNEKPVSMLTVKKLEAIFSLDSSIALIDKQLNDIMQKVGVVN